MWSRKKRDVTDVLQGASWYPMLSPFKQQEKAVAVVLCCIGLVDLDKPLPSSLTWGNGRDKALGSKYIFYMPRKENVMRLWFQKKNKNKNKKHLTLYISHGRSRLKIVVCDLGWLYQGQPFHQGLPDSQNCLTEDTNRRCLAEEEVLKEFSFFSLILSDALELLGL